MKSRRAFSLVDMLFSLSLLAAFAVLGYRLVGANMDFVQSTLRADDASARFDRAIAMLRSDVTASDSMQLNAQTLHLRACDWKIDGKSLIRTVGSETRSWEIGQALKFQMDGAILLVTTPTGDQLPMAPKGVGQ